MEEGKTSVNEPRARWTKLSHTQAFFMVSTRLHHEALAWRNFSQALYLAKCANSCQRARGCHTVLPQSRIIYDVVILQPDIPALKKKKRGGLVVQKPIEIQVGKCFP